jgi:hypothetical protein
MRLRAAVGSLPCASSPQAPRRLHLGVHARLRSTLALRSMRSAPASRLPASATRVPLLPVSSGAPALLARLHSRPCYIMRRCAQSSGRSHCTCIQSAIANGCTRRPVRAARRTTHTMQNGRRAIPVPRRCAAPCRADTSCPCALRGVPALLGVVVRRLNRCAVQADRDGSGAIECSCFSRSLLSINRSRSCGRITRASCARKTVGS